MVSDNDYLFLNEDLGFINFSYHKTKKFIAKCLTGKSKPLGENSEKQVL